MVSPSYESVSAVVAVRTWLDHVLLLLRTKIPGNLTVTSHLTLTLWRKTQHFFLLTVRFGSVFKSPFASDPWGDYLVTKHYVNVLSTDILLSTTLPPTLLRYNSRQ